MWVGVLAGVAVVLWVAAIAVILLGSPPPPPPPPGAFVPPPPPPGVHPAVGWSVVLAQMAIAATVLTGVLGLDYRRWGHDIEIEARAEARYQEVLDTIRGGAAQSQERLTQAKWQGYADALRETSGVDSTEGEVVQLGVRRNGAPRQRLTGDS